jgi:cell wall-associated NlpC family hydrolase
MPQHRCRSRIRAPSQRAGSWRGFPSAAQPQMGALAERLTLRPTIPGARALVSAALAATLLISSAPPTPAAAADPSEANQVIAIAKAQIGDPWRYGASGPSAFDCSGLVIYSFKMAGDLSLIGNGNYRSASALYTYFRDRGRTSRTSATPGDLVIWGNGSHVGIYIGGGKAISTLTTGVTIHAVNAVTAPFTAYLRTGIYQLPSATPVPAPTATPVPVGAIVINR